MGCVRLVSSSLFQKILEDTPLFQPLPGAGRGWKRGMLFRVAELVELALSTIAAEL